MNSPVQSAAVQPAKDAKAVEKNGEKDPAETLPWLPCTLTLEIPVINFTVGDLLKLGKGSIIETACHHTSDIPLRVNGQLVGWTEFEVIGDRLAVRITEIA